jgi:hypothetical protein
VVLDRLLVLPAAAAAAGERLGGLRTALVFDFGAHPSQLTPPLAGPEPDAVLRCPRLGGCMGVGGWSGRVRG